MTITAVIDRYEEDSVVLLLGEDEEEQVIFPQDMFPTELEEGDYVRIEIEPDEEKTSAARTEAADLLRDLQDSNDD